MMLFWEIVIAALLVLAGVFGLVGSYGLIKLPDTMSRLHAPTKATTLGVGGVLIASMIYFAVFLEQISVHELIVTLFLFITAPVSANFMAKAWILRHARPGELPPTGTARDWATLDLEDEKPEPKPRPAATGADRPA